MTLYTWRLGQPTDSITEKFTFDGVNTITFVESAVVSPGFTTRVLPHEIMTVEEASMGYIDHLLSPDWS